MRGLYQSSKHIEVSVVVKTVLKCSFEWYFEYVPVNWSNYSNFDFTSKSKKKFRTDLNNVEKLQEVKSTFTGKIQVGDNREIDRNGLRIMIKVLSINSTDE